MVVDSGVVVIIVGLLQILVASALGRGSRVARLLFGIVAVLNFAGGVHAAIALHGNQRASGAVSAAIGFIVLYLLYGSERTATIHGLNPYGYLLGSAAARSSWSCADDSLA